MKHFLPAFCVAGLALIMGGVLGYWQTLSVSGAMLGVESVAILALMEIAESMDNAIVDYGILRHMPPVWQRRYMSWGMPVSVLGMRFAFPVLIVALIAGISPISAVSLALEHPDRYSHVIIGARDNISAFGGCFLLLIAFSYFFDEEKEVHWCRFLERPMARLGGIPGIAVGLTLSGLVIADYGVDDLHSRFSFLLWGVLGIVSYVLVKEALSWLIGEPNAEKMTARCGLLSFFYLEFIDGSFSFDGVISAFAITADPVVIALGLGVGALFVRSMTLSMLETHALAEFDYVENGAFYTILILAGLMLCSVMYEVPEWATGSVGFVLIGGAFWASLAKNKRKIQE